MRKLSRRTVFDIFIICLLGLVPLFWLNGKEVILGHDAGLTLSPVSHFTDRLYVWTERFGIGSDQSYALPGFFIHGLEALWFILTNSLQQAQKITFIFWLILPGLAMYSFARSVFSTRRFLPLIASVFFMFNHFLLQGWFVVERTKFSTYTALPLMLIIIIKLFERKLSPLKAGILSAFVLFFLNGGGSLPLFGSLIVLVVLAFIYFIFLDFSASTIKRAIAYLAITGVSTVLLSAFWLLPFIYYVLNQFSLEIARASGVEGVIGWAKVISQNTSLLNLMRLQGIPDWYRNPYHPYSNLFLQNIFLIAASFMFPVLAFVGKFLIKDLFERKIMLFFMLLALVGMLFAAGLHSPTGFIYELMVRFVPGFLVFRTPFYKFAPLIWFSYSILIALTLDELLTKLRKWKPSVSNISQFAIIPILIFIVLYNFPFLDGRFFNYEKERSTRVSIPQYIFDFQKWVDSSQNKNKRFLLLPALRTGNKLETYTWGYFSITPLTSLITNAQILENGPYNNENEDLVLNTVYDKMLKNEAGWEDLAKSLGIDKFIVRGDYKWDVFGSPTRSPIEYETSLKNSPSIFLDKVFGQWKVYSFRESAQPIITASQKISYADSEPAFIQHITEMLNFDFKTPLYFKRENSLLLKNNNFFLSNSDSNYLVPKCIACDLPNDPLDKEDEKEPLILPGSPFYPIVKNREKNLRTHNVSLSQKVDFLLKISLRRLREAKRMIDLQINPEIVDSPISEQLSLIRELNNLLVDKEQFNSEEGNNLLIKIESYSNVQRKLLAEIFSKAPIDEKLINQNNSEMVEIENKVASWEWRTKEDSNKHYLITAQIPGTYNLFLRRDRLELPLNTDPAKMTFKFSIDGNSYEQKAEQVNDTWILLKRIFLTKDIHKVNLNLEPPELFEDKTATSSSNVYSAKSLRNRNCTSFNANNLEQGASYRVNFQYRKLQGEQKFRLIVSSKKEELLPLTKIGISLQDSPVWKGFRASYQFYDSNSFFVNICTDSLEQEKFDIPTLIEIKDFSIKKISFPVLVLVKEKTEDLQGPKVIFDKINQTKYKIRISGAEKRFFLTFEEKFSPDWKLSFSDSKKAIAEKDHFISNVYANSWYIDKIGSFDLSLEYKPQRLFYFGSIISIIGLILITIIFLLKKD